MLAADRCWFWNNERSWLPSVARCQAGCPAVYNDRREGSFLRWLRERILFAGFSGSELPGCEFLLQGRYNP
jgi:hypothetical protein